MIVAVVGSRGLSVSGVLGKYLPRKISEIVSGGAVGVDSDARQYALDHGIKLTEFLPEYEKYGRKAPLVRNKSIVLYADFVLAFWDGKSKGTANVIKSCGKLKRPCKIISV